MIRVALADDHQVVREGVRRLLEAEPDLRVVAQAPSGRALLRELASRRCDVVVIDLSMPGLHGRALVEALRSAHPELAIVIFSMYPEDPLALHFLRDGVHAYVSKERPPGDLIDAIRLAARGKCYLPSPMTAPGSDPAPAHGLSAAMQSGAMFLLLQGLDAEQIAAELHQPVAVVARFVAAAHRGEIDTPLGGLIGHDPSPAAQPDVANLRLGPVRIDLESGAVEHPEGAHTLTETEGNLLRFLVRHAGETVSAQRLLTDVWHYAERARSRTVTTTISRLRRKIELDPAQPRHLLTILGEGYRLELGG